jgi:hypothetical protein
MVGAWSLRRGSAGALNSLERESIPAILWSTVGSGAVGCVSTAGTVTAGLSSLKKLLILDSRAELLLRLTVGDFSDVSMAAVLERRRVVIQESASMLDWARKWYSRSGKITIATSERF